VLVGAPLDLLLRKALFDRGDQSAQLLDLVGVRVVRGLPRRKIARTRFDTTPIGTKNGETMALENLSNEEMAAISDAWVDPGSPACEAMRSINRLLPLTPKVTVRHKAIADLLECQTGDDAADNARAIELNRLHTTLATAIYDYLGAIAQLSDHAEEVFALRAELLPDGLLPIRRGTYRDQAGFTAALQRRLDTTLRARLMALPLPDGTLLEKVDAWAATGVELGKLAETWARTDSGAEPADGAHALRARQDWIRMVDAVVAVARLSELEPVLERLLFGPLFAAEAIADRRAAQHATALQRSRSGRRISEVMPKVESARFPGSKAG
jgi:hypothetical protein